MIVKQFIAALLAFCFGFWGVPVEVEHAGNLTESGSIFLPGAAGLPAGMLEADLGEVPELGELTYLGNTTGAPHWTGHPSGDHLLSFIVSTAGDYRISLCHQNTAFDTCLGLYRDAGCTDELAWNDDHEGSCSLLETSLDHGMYWIHVEGSDLEEGSYELHLTNTRVPEKTRLVLAGDNDCPKVGDLYQIDLMMSQATSTVRNGRISLEYDNNRLDLVEVGTGESVFNVQLLETTGPGVIDCELTSDRGAIADALLATLVFRALEPFCPEDDLVYFKGGLSATQLEDGLGQTLNPELVGLGVNRRTESTISDDQPEMTVKSGGAHPEAATGPAQSEEGRLVIQPAGHGGDSDQYSRAPCTGDVDIDGVGTATWNYPFSSYYHDARTTSIYLASEFGCDGGNINTMQYYVVSAAGQTLNAFTIRMRHTALSSYSSGTFENTGWTTVYQAAETVASTGWYTFTFSTPFTWNGTDNLEVDVCFNNSTYTSDSSVYFYASGSGSRSKYYRCDSCTCGSSSDPLSWDCAGSLTTNVPRAIFSLTAPARPCASCTPEDVAFGTIGTAVYGYSVSGDCGNGGKWVGSFTGVSGDIYHFDVCPDAPGSGSNSGFDPDIKICDASCTILTGQDGSCSAPTYSPNDYQWTCPADGTYYVIFAPYSSYSSHNCTGDATDTFTLEYYRESSCDVVCTGTPEGEVTCYDDYVDTTNGGCNSTPNVFGSVANGETICGTYGTYLVSGSDSRDTDWYEFTVPVHSEVTWTVTGEGPTLAFIVDTGCTGLASATADLCVPAVVTLSLTPGTYYGFVAPSEYTGVTCGAEYEATLSMVEIIPTCDDVLIDLGTVGSCHLNYSGDTTTGANYCDARTANDAHFSFTVATQDDITITTCAPGTAFDTVVYLYADQCCGTPVTSDDDNCTGYWGTASTIVQNLLPGTYYVNVEGYSGSGPYELWVHGTTSDPPPANQLCANAIPLTVPSVTTGSTTCAAVTSAPTCVTSVTAPGAWYSVVGNGCRLRASLCGAVFYYDTKICVYTDGCGTMTCVTGNDDDSACATNTLMSSMEWDSIDGVTYLILVHGYSANFGDFDLSLDVVDTVSPSVGGLTVDGGAVDASCQATVTFSASVTDNCCVAEGDVSVSYAVLTGNATASDLVVNKAQAAQGQVDISGSLLVSGLTGCPATVQITVDGTDCHGGNPVSLSGTADVSDNTDPVISGCPGNITVNAEAGGCTAVVNWTAPSAADNCSLASFVSTHNPGATFSGVTTVTYTATDACGNSDICSFDVTVEPVNEVLVDLQLFGGYEPGPFTRCITFELYDCGGSNTHTMEQELSFSSGAASATLLVPCGLYTCISARENLHSLRRVIDTLPIAAGKYDADFTAVSTEDLVGGNLLGDDWIDIIDYGIFAANYGANYGTGSTTCATASPHADISGNGVVGTEDFTHIQTNFLMASETPCCGTPMPLPPPVVSITVGELEKRGLGELAVADLNQDGVLDQQDMTAFMQGQRPGVKTDRSKLD